MHWRAPRRVDPELKRFAWACAGLAVLAVLALWLVPGG